MRNSHASAGGYGAACFARVSGFAAIFLIKLTEGTQYRAAWISSAAISIFWGIIETVVYHVFYTHAANLSAVNTAALTLTQTMSYIWLLQALLGLSPMSPDGEILEKIRNGDIGIELCRPTDLYAFWYTKTAAGRLVPMAWRGLPTLLAGLLMPVGWRLSAPASAAGLALMLLSSVCALLLSASYSMLVTAVRMNITWGDGPMHIILLMGMVFSGGYLPLQLWPDALQKILLYQPFAGFLDIPLRFYIGTTPPQDAWKGFALQLGWTLVFVTAGRLIMRARLRKIVVQGG